MFWQEKNAVFLEKIEQNLNIKKSKRQTFSSLWVKNKWLFLVNLLKTIYTIMKFESCSGEFGLGTVSTTNVLS